MTAANASLEYSYLKAPATASHVKVAPVVVMPETLNPVGDGLVVVKAVAADVEVVTVP